jgi:aspartyl/asparaginyl beta-hydroxylase (cupin superfamily)
MMNKKWYSFSESLEYNGTEPAFFNIENKPWAKLLKANHAVILSEIIQLIDANDKGIIPYFNKTLASNANDWTILPLYVWGKKNEINATNCRVTTKIIESITGMTSCSFSILNPHTTIKPHHGDSNVMYRCHLTLKCDDGLPQIGMRVKDETIEWKNGEIFAFCDAYEHEVWNKTDSKRLVLILDVIREDFENDKKQICAEVNATMFWQLKFQKFYFIKHLPKWSRKLLLKITAVFF